MNQFIQLLAGLLCLWLALWRMVGDRWGWLGMLNAWAEWGIGAIALLAVQAGWQRKWMRGMTLLGFVAIGTTHYRKAHHAFNNKKFQKDQTVADKMTIHRTKEATLRYASRQGTTFTIFSANLYKSNNSAVEHIALIQEHEPDVICLQELTPHLADEFLSVLGEIYRFKAWDPKPGAYGYGVLSRFPVEQTGEWVKPGVRAWGQRVRLTLTSLANPERLESPEIDDKIIEVYNVHLLAPTSSATLKRGMTWGFRTREQQIRFIQQEIKLRAYPACVIGDHNFTPSSDIYQMTQETLSDSWQTVGHGFRWTWPTRSFPFKRLPWTPRLLCLDYCFHNDGLIPQTMEVLTERTGSDHCPLLVRFTVD